MAISTPLVLLPPGFVERGDFYHELGHVFDAWVLTDAARERYRRLHGDARGWDEWTLELGSPAEHFAEAYAACAEHRRLPGWWLAETHDYGFTTTPAQHVAVCRFIRQVYRRETGGRFGDRHGR